MIVNRENLIERLKHVFPFNQAGDDQISSLAGKCEVVYFKKGDVIFNEGASASYLYVVFEGQVEVLKEEGHSLQRKNLLSAGDLLGEDVLSESLKREASARALEDTLLIRIALPVLTKFIQRNQELRRHFQIMIDSYRVLLSNRQDFDLDGETIHFIGRPHKIFLITRAIFFLIFALLAGCAAQYLSSVGFLSAKVALWAFIISFSIYFFWLAWNVAEWSNDIFIFTDRRVISLDRGLFIYESREETPLDAVVSLTSQSNVLGRQYGFGDLSIRTFTGLLILKNLPQIATAQKLLEFLIDRSRADRQQEEKKDFENLLRSRRGLQFEQTAEMNMGDSSGERIPPGEENSESFANTKIGKIRKDDSVVVYRTHWLFLLRKTIFPTLLIVSLVLIDLFMFANLPAIINSAVAQTIFAVLLVLATGWWLFQYLDWRNDQYIITPEQLIDIYRRPLGLEDKRTAPLESIQSIRYKRQGLLGLIFNYGAVYVKVGNEDFAFENIHNPLEVQQTLFGYLERANLIEKQASLVEQRRQMADWMDTYQRFNREHPDGSDAADK